MTNKKKPNGRQTSERCNDWRTGQKFNKDELIELSLEAISQHNLVFISEIIPFLPYSQSTFYNYKMERLESLKEALQRNRIDLKPQIRRKLLESDHPIALIASYKLFATQDELQRLSNNSRQTHEHKQTKPFEFTLNLNPNNRIRERLEAKQLTDGDAVDDYIDAEDPDNYDT